MTEAATSLLAERINAALPQTQCTRCGYPDCAAYAQAIADGLAPINQCPPGGSEGIARLAALTGQKALPLNPDNGVEAPRAVAVIDEAWCIGCTLCLPACPTDAIFGSNKAMHSIIEPHCTGCALCLPVCPVDCISLEEVTSHRTGWSAWSGTQAQDARHRYETHRLRLGPGGAAGSGSALQTSVPVDAPAGATLHPDATRNPHGQALETVRTDGDTPITSNLSEANQRKRAVIDAALARARALRQP